MTKRKFQVPEVAVRRDEDQAMVIGTFRVLLAACVQKFGLRGELVLTPAALVAAGTGTLKVTDRPDGSIVLVIKQEKDS